MTTSAEPAAAVKTVDQNEGAGEGYGRKFTGMKGVFKDGRFVDDEEPPQMRNIEYNLSPEKMEKIWVRVKKANKSSNLPCNEGKV